MIGISHANYDDSCIVIVSLAGGVPCVCVFAMARGEEASAARQYDLMANYLFTPAMTLGRSWPRQYADKFIDRIERLCAHWVARLVWHFVN